MTSFLKSTKKKDQIALPNSAKHSVRFNTSTAFNSRMKDLQNITVILAVKQKIYTMVFIRHKCFEGSHLLSKVMESFKIGYAEFALVFLTVMQSAWVMKTVYIPNKCSFCIPYSKLPNKRLNLTIFLSCKM